MQALLLMRRVFWGVTKYSPRSDFSNVIVTMFLQTLKNHILCILKFDVKRLNNVRIRKIYYSNQ